MNDEVDGWSLADSFRFYSSTRPAPGATHVTWPKTGANREMIRSHGLANRGIQFVKRLQIPQLGPRMDVSGSASATHQGSLSRYSQMTACLIQ